MAINKGAAAPIITTAFAEFSPCNPERDALLAVNPGVSVKDALEKAQVFLTSVDHLVNSIADQTDDGNAWAAIYLLDMSRAIIQSSVQAILMEEKRNGQ